MADKAKEELNKADAIKAEIEAKKKKLEALKIKNQNKNKEKAAEADKHDAPASSPHGGADLEASLKQVVGETISRSKPQLGVVHQEPLNIEPVQRHQYDKEVQCDLLQPPKLTGKAADLEKELQEEKERLVVQEQKLKALMEELKHDKIKYDQLREDERLREHKEFSAAEQRSIEESPEFQSFFSSASRIVERSLTASRYDVTTDYTMDTEEIKKKDKLVQQYVFKDEKRTNRAVSAIAWSPKFSELLLAAYAGQEDPMSLDPDGTVLVWNLHMPNRPEYSFFCNSAVLTAQFHPSNPKLIVGGCRSGQVVIWDTREKSTPVNRTSLSHGHTYPVYALQCAPLVNKIHNIVSLSTDGHLCVWADNNLHNPSSEFHLQPKKEANKEEITTTSFDFTGRDSGNLLLGSDEGLLYKARIYDNEGIYESVAGHDAPVTNVQFHPMHKNAPTNYSDYYLTSSYDWTVKVWSTKLSRPLYTIESARDYVFDVQWSPTHPAVLAFGDGTGKLDVVNLNADAEIPVHSLKVDARSDTGEKGAVSRVRWSENGAFLSAGTSTGSVHLYEVSQDLVEPGAEDVTTFYDKLHKRQISL